MKKIITGFVLAALLSGCASTNFTWVYKSDNYDLKSYKRIAVVAFLPRTEGRVQVENAVVSALTAKGLHGWTTWSIFVFVNNPEVLKQVGFEGEKRQQVIREKVAQNNIDAILTITLFDAKKEQRYVPGTLSLGIAAPVYGMPYYGYYDYAYAVISTPGYYVDESTYFVETNLYDVASAKLLWTGQTSTQIASSLEKEAATFANLLVNKMIEDGKSTTTGKK